MTKIREVIAAAGGVTALARELQVTPPTVSQWSTGKRPVPARFALLLAREYPGLVTAQDLRPELGCMAGPVTTPTADDHA